jgi:adenine phosphoribosyltransferase
MTTTMALDLNDYLPSVADFPKPGVAFRDICPLLASPEAFAQSIAGLAAAARGRDVARIAGIESRGLVFASALALHLHLPLVPVRKPGKLPPPVVRAQYALEYGSDSLELQGHAVHPGESVLIVDDVIATGGTLLAAAQLVRQLGGTVAGVAAVLEIGVLGGGERLRAAGLTVHALLRS